jgi:hypothetical protein
MSATNRGSKRIDSDFYVTPISAIESMLKSYKLGKGNILEPSAGSGSFIKTIREYGYDNHITAVEVRDEEYTNLKLLADKAYIDDFLNWTPDRDYRYIIGNPPYSIAQEFIERCFEISNEYTEIIMLLRLGFLESKKRYSFWQQHPVNSLMVLSDRPKFINNKSDFSAYAFFIWNKTRLQEISVI